MQESLLTSLVLAPSLFCKWAFTIYNKKLFRPSRPNKTFSQAFRLEVCSTSAPTRASLSKLFFSHSFVYGRRVGSVCMPSRNEWREVVVAYRRSVATATTWELAPSGNEAVWCRTRTTQSYKRDLKSNMGITKLADLIHFDAPDSKCNKEIGDYSGKINAVLLKYNKTVN